MRSKELLFNAFDPKAFQAAATQITGQLAQYLEHCLNGSNGDAREWQAPESLLKVAQEFLNSAPGLKTPLLSPEKVAERVGELTQTYLSANTRLHSPLYMGHQVCPAVPVGGIFEAIGSTTNQPSGIFEMGAFPVVAEKALSEKLSAYLGWESKPFDAIVTHGGSLANLTAVLAARNNRYENSWEQGTSSHKARPAIITSADSHYSISRAAGILGIGTDQVIKGSIDSRRKMTGASAQLAIDEARNQGLEPFCLVGSACATPTGAFDFLEEIGQVAQQNGLWYHVDGAHGASLLLSPRYREKLKGIELADSVTWDAHKMMFVPSLCTFLLFKDKRQSYQTFSQDAPYLFDSDKNSMADYDPALRTVECTKRPLAMAAFALWATYGPELFTQLVEATIDSARTFYEIVQNQPDFEALHEPECNIFCFRYVPKFLKDAESRLLSDFQSTIRRRLLLQGHHYITGTRLDGVYTLRVTVMNPFSDQSHFETLLSSIRNLGNTLNQEQTA